VASSRAARVLQYIVSPYGLALISSAFFLLSCLMPPSVYTYYMQEPDLMFCDATTILFFSLCVAFFLFGVWLIDFVFPIKPIVEDARSTRIPPVLFILIPLMSAVVVSAISSLLLIKQNPIIITLLRAQQASQLRTDDGSGVILTGTMNSAPLFLTGVLWWARGRSWSLVGLKRKERFIIGLALSCSVLAIFVSSTLAVSRHELVLALIGLGCCYIFRQSTRSNVRWAQIWKPLVVFFGGGISFFYLVNVLRYGSGSELQLGPFIGYTVASYNRLAALLLGRLHFEYAGRGIYFSNFLAFNHTINAVIPYGKFMNIPDYFDWWRSSFAAVGNAGLDSGLIFFGAFGELYLEVGWFTPLCLIAYGMLVGIIWQQMRKRTVVGIILYPYCANYILFWFATNSLFDTDFAALLGDVLLLSIFEYMLTRRVPAADTALVPV
jgi:hypothetical protein